MGKSLVPALVLGSRPDLNTKCKKMLVVAAEIFLLQKEKSVVLSENA